MKKIILILAAMLTLASCTKEGDVIYQTDPADAPSAKPLVTVIYDPNAVGDGNYNDLIYQSVEQAAKEHDLRTMHLSPSSRTEGLAYLETLFEQMSAAQDTVRRLFIVAAIMAEAKQGETVPAFYITRYNLGDDLHFTATTTLTKGGQVTATYGPRREHFIRTEADYSEAVLGLWEIFFTSDDPEYESSEPYRELYRADGTCSYYDLIDGQWVEEETVLSEYFADGPLFCFRWQKPGKELRRENWEIISCENVKMVNKAFLRHADGTTYAITAHLTKVLEKV